MYTFILYIHIYRSSITWRKMELLCLFSIYLHIAVIYTFYIHTYIQSGDAGCSLRCNHRYKKGFPRRMLQTNYQTTTQYDAKRHIHKVRLFLCIDVCQCMRSCFYYPKSFPKFSMFICVCVSHIYIYIRTVQCENTSPQGMRLLDSFFSVSSCGFTRQLYMYYMYILLYSRG